MYEDGVSSVLIVGHLHLLNVGRSMAALMELPMRMPNEDLIAFSGEGRGSSICPLKRCRRWAINYAMLRWPGGTTRIQGSGIRDASWFFLEFTEPGDTTNWPPGCCGIPISAIALNAQIFSRFPAADFYSI